MKKTFIESIKIIAVALVIGWGVSGVSAFTPGSFPNDQVPAIINTSVNNQVKVGGLLSEKYFLSDLSFFTKTLLPGKDSWLNIGSPLQHGGIGDINNNGSTIPLIIDLTGRTKVVKNRIEGQNAINFISGQAHCAKSTAFINDRASAFEFTSGGTDTGHADLIARQLQLSGGSPQDGSVLASDANGNAVWAKLVIQGGVLKVINNQTGFPVVADADCTVQVYHWVDNWAGCKIMDDNGSGTYIEMNNPMCKDSNNRRADGHCGSLPVPLFFRDAASSLPLCRTSTGGGAGGSLKMWRCHSTNPYASWIGYPGPGGYQDTCTTQSAPPSNPATEGQLSCYDGIPPYICAGGTY